jgi:hypothetical protein
VANNNKIENIAVNKVNEIMLKSQVLEAFIDANDRTPSWDGNIIVYNSNVNIKDNIKGKVPIQVKGKIVKAFIFLT